MKEFTKGFGQGFKEFGHNISRVLNTALLFVVYIIGIGITSLVAKSFKKKFLETKISNDKTYYCELNLKKRPKEEYLRQF